MEPKEQRKVDDFIVYAMEAADQALADAGWNPKTEEERDSTGVLIGSGIGWSGQIARRSVSCECIALLTSAYRSAARPSYRVPHGGKEILHASCQAAIAR